MHLKQHGGTAVSAVASQLEGSEFNSTIRLVEFACSPCLCGCFPGTPASSNSPQAAGLTGNSNLACV